MTVLKQTIKDNYRHFIWNLGYRPLVPPKQETLVEMIQKSIRTRPGRELESEIENIMFELKLYNSSGEYAMHLNTDKKAENHYITYWQIPRGLSYRQYQDKKEVFSNNLRGQVIIEERNGSLMIEVIQGILPSKKGFEFDISNYPDMLLPIMVGWDQAGAVVVDLQSIVHLLITGTTGTGKSICMQNIILSLANNPNVLLYGCDIGRVNMAFISDRAVFAKDINESVDVISYLVNVMHKRLEIIENISGCVDIVAYNETNPNNKLPFLILLIDEFGFTSEKMTRIKEEKEIRRLIYTKIASMALLARKTGIHLVVGLQKSSDELIPTTVRDMFTGRIAHRAESQSASQVSLGTSDAYYLPGIPGRAILKIGNEVKEFQGAYYNPKKARAYLAKTSLRRDDNYYAESTANRLPTS